MLRPPRSALVPVCALLLLALTRRPVLVAASALNNPANTARPIGRAVFLHGLGYDAGSVLGLTLEARRPPGARLPLQRADPNYNDQGEWSLRDLTGARVVKMLSQGKVPGPEQHVFPPREALCLWATPSARTRPCALRPSVPSRSPAWWRSRRSSILRRGLGRTCSVARSDSLVRARDPP